MERRKLRALVMTVVVLGILVGQSTATFKDCYAKCFLFCMIEPSQNLCSCTTHCLKECIFPDNPQPQHVNADSHGFCKLGCAYSSCSNMSTKHDPNGKVVENCVGSCSKMCTKNYLSP
ncbi:unnamed protein product [Ilex paraguariensis]|uniref:Thionin-like protein 2 n=1 Tax=Ilex paraguariensis TaxID=185542 RepID=A0ABC8TYQ3_9AQUA